MSRNHFVSGDWNCICDVCNKKIKSSEARLRWDGFLVCPEDFEQRHPQDFVKARQDKISVPFTRPIPTTIFVPQNFTERVSDGVRILDDISFVVSWDRTTTETVSSLETVAVSFGKRVSDVVTTSENITSMIFKLVTITDTVHPTDNISTVAISPTQIDGAAVNGELL